MAGGLFSRMMSLRFLSSNIGCTVMKRWCFIPIHFNYRCNLLFATLTRWKEYSLLVWSLAYLRKKSHDSQLSENHFRNCLHDGMYTFIIVFGLAMGIVWYCWYLLSSEFPSEQCFLNEWLQNYPQHINLGADAIILTLSLMLCIALVTVGYHTWWTAHTDPVVSLRNE